MKLTRRVRLAAVATTIAVVTSVGGMVPFLVTKADAAPAPSDSLLTLCLTVVPLGVPHTCVTI